MRSLLLVAIGAAFMLTACGSSHSSVSRAPIHPKAVRVAGEGRPIRAIVAQRKRQAGRKAETLLDRMILPSAARHLPERTGSGVVSSVNLGVNVFTQYEYRHDFWQVPEALPSVVAFLKRHPPPNYKLGGVGNAETYPHQGVWFESRSPAERLSSRLLVSLVPFEVGTAVRVDAGAAWTYPRSPREVVPAAVREIDIGTLSLQPALKRAGAKKVSLRVTNPRRVARIVGWFNALNVVQPRTYVLGCMVVLYVPVSFVFRSAHGADVASAVVPSVAASSCEQIQFTLHGRPQMSLIDRTPYGGVAFIDRVQRLLDVRFGPRRAGL